MISYKLCSDSTMSDVFEAFKIGFSDYMIKFEMTMEAFEKRFFGPEGNSLEYSFIAYDDELPIGLILGGMKVYEGIKTLRCGALCIHPDYRGKGVSLELYKLHKQVAQANNCKQLFLEVIVGNDRAISFYKKLGYDKIYDLAYYSCKDPFEIHDNPIGSIEIKEIDINTLREVSSEIRDVHINWQNDFDYIEKIDGQIHYSAYQNTTPVGVISIHKSGKISFLWVNPELRLKGIGKSLMNHSINKLNLQKLVISFPNNASIEGFIKHLNFTKDPISQYEMYLTL